LTSLVYTVSETLRYRGAIGQWSWVLHRISGLGVVLFLTLHVIDTSWAVFYPELYVKAIAAYQSPLFTLGEFALVACVIYHALNGIRIAIFDARPVLWRYQARAAWFVLGGTILILIPVFALMFTHVLEFYQSGRAILPLGDVLVEQLPFAIGIAGAAIVAIIVSALMGAVTGNQKPGRVSKGRGAPLERFWWSFMRLSGMIILPLVFGHLALAHIIQGVFDITVAGSTVAGTLVQFNTNDILANGINETGTAVEYVAERWNFLLAGVAIWRIYDIGLLALVVLHGFNGLRYVLTDYTNDNALLRRASVILCIIAGVVLLTVGGLALIGSIQMDAVNAAQQAALNLGLVGE
jgi:succinate dehydrogenase / fumarate reductase cytochrome b subunit